MARWKLTTRDAARRTAEENLLRLLGWLVRMHAVREKARQQGRDTTGHTRHINQLLAEAEAAWLMYQRRYKGPGSDS